MREKILDGRDYKGPGVIGRLVLIVLCLYVLVFGAFSYWQINIWIDQHQISQIRSSERILSELESKLRSNPDATKSFYSGLFKRYAVRDQFIQEIKFRDRNGQVFSNIDSGIKIQTPQKQKYWLKLKEETIDSVVKKQDAVLGHLSIKLNNDFTRKQVWKKWRRITNIVTSITLFFVFIMFMFLRSNIRVLRSVVSLGDKISNNNFKFRVDESGSAEARATCQTINQLATLMENMAFSMTQNKKSLLSELKRVEEDSVEAVKLRESAEVANQSKSEYLSNVSEEFRTPLTSIMSLSEMMMKPEYQSQQRHFSEMIHASAIHLLNYINNVLDIAQLESEEIVVKKDIFDFRSIFREVNEMAIPYAAQHEKTFNMLLDNDIPYYVISDAPRIKQLMLSTICDVIANGEHPTVFMKCHVLQSNVLSLSVQFDVYANNKQIKSTEDVDWAKISEAQAENRVCDLYGKAGVGLPVARKVVSALEGKLEEKSYEQQDHSFKFTMPLERPSETRVMEYEKQLLLANEQVASRRTLRVLLAESHLINRYVYELVFFHRGHVTVKVDNGKDALKELQKGSFDFAILDQQMPGLSAVDLARQWRELERKSGSGKTLPILIVTSDAKQQTITECRSYANLVEIKPVSPYALVNEVERFIDNPVRTAPVPERAADTEAKTDELLRDLSHNNSLEEIKIDDEEAVKLDDLLDLATIDKWRASEGSDKVDKRISNFYSLFEAELLNLKTALHAGDPTAYKTVTGRIADDTAKIGARALQDQFRQLQGMDSDFVLGNSDNVIDAISQVYADTRLAYKKHLQNN